MDQTLGGRLQLSSSLVGSDYVLKNNRITKLDLYQNIKFSLKPITESKLYESLFILDHRYPSPGWFEISIQVKNLSLIKSVFITDEKNLDSYCYLVSFNEANCSVVIYSQNINDQLKVESNTMKLKNQKVNYIGYNFLTIRHTHQIDTEINLFLLTSIEFAFETNLIGFDIFASKPGIIQIEILNFMNCGLSISCMRYFSQKSDFELYEILSSWNFTLTKGSNRIFLPGSFSVQKGYILALRQSSVVALDETKDYLPDHMINKQSKLETLNFRFCINALINQIMYQNLFSFSKQFPTFGGFEIQIELVDANLKNKHQFLIEKCNKI